MSFQIVRGRDPKPPLRAVRGGSGTAADLHLQEATTLPLPAKAPARKPLLRFPVNSETRAFYRRFYPGTTTAEWNDWRWQMRTRIRTLEELARIFTLSEDETQRGGTPQRFAACRHHAILREPDGPRRSDGAAAPHPCDDRRRIHPACRARTDDPLGEDHDTVAPGIVHRYPDRVLFLTTGTCSTYCRYCTRSRVVGNPGGEYQFSVKQWEKALAYLEAHTEVRDVLLSGGDPLTIGDDKLDWLLTRLRAIKHIEFLRIGTKVPMVLPQRITKDLVKMLKKHHPLWMSIHVTHPRRVDAGE